MTPSAEPVQERLERSVHSRPIAFVFPGQGSQAVGMGRALAEAYPAAAEVFAHADRILDFSLSKLCFEGPEDQLRRTANAQPALLTCSIAVLRVLEQAGIHPDVLAGHSLGEFSAWVAAGAISFEHALLLVRMRGELMEQAGASNPGGMMAVLGLDQATLKDLVSQVRTGTVVMANINCPGQIVVSGEENALRALRELAMQNGARAVPLRVSGAFHSPLMESSSRIFKRELTKLKLHPARPAVVCNTTAKPTRTPDAIRQAMAAQMTSPVLWEASVQKIAQLGASIFLEVGPGEVLCGLIKRILTDAQAFPVGEPEQVKHVVEALGEIEPVPAAASEQGS